MPAKPKTPKSPRGTKPEKGKVGGTPTKKEEATCYKLLTVIKLPSAYTVNTVCIIYCQDRNTKQALASDYTAGHCSHCLHCLHCFNSKKAFIPIHINWLSHFRAL